MREIKFRAWDSKQKKMYKSDIIMYGKSYSMDLLDMKDEETSVKFENESDIIMQFTGLKDKNGKEIYEGDIAISTYGKWEEDKKGLTRIGKIVYDEKMASFRLSIKDSAVKVGFYDINKTEVIGNIHENPELL